MSITREQVADLQPGDVVVLVDEGCWPAGSFVQGPLVEDATGSLRVANRVVRFGATGVDMNHAHHCTLTIYARAPRPLYVNHPRTEPVVGDVARDADSDDTSTWMQDADGTWLTIPGAWIPGNGMPTRLRLLVDGDTGQVVP